MPPTHSERKYPPPHPAHLTMGDIDVQHPDRPGSSDGSSYNSRSPTGDESSLDSTHDTPLDFSIKKSSRESSPGEYGSPRPGLIRSPELGQTAVPPNGFSSRPTSTEPIKEEKIGEPQTALPGVPPGTTIPTTTAMLPGGFPSGLLPNMAAMGLMAGLPLMGLTDPKQLQNLQAQGMPQPTSTTPNGPNGANGANGKSARPFKAYPKDPLTLPLGYFGLPGQNPFPGMDVTQAQAMQAGSEEMFKQYRDFYLKHQAELQQRAKSISPPLPGAGIPQQPQSTPSPPEFTKIKPEVMKVAPTSTTPVSSPSPNISSGTLTPPAQSPPSVSTTTPATPGTTPSAKNTGGRKRTLPEEQKDNAYWERRRKNNDAAKRSRDARRAKEDEIAIRAAFLEQENLKLRVEVTALKNETAKLRCMLYNS